MLAQNELFRKHGARLVRAAAARRDREPGDARLAERHREHEGRAERELRARDDGAVHARRRPRRVHRARRARAGAVADRLDEPLEPAQGRVRLPLRREPPRHRREDRVPQDRATSPGGTPATSALEPPEARVVLRPQAVELLHPGRARRGRRSARSKRAYTAGGFQIRPVLDIDPQASGAARRAAHGEAADRPHRRPAAPDRRRRHDRRVGVDRRARRAAALLPAERRRLGRLPLARHRDVPRPLDRRAARSSSDQRSTPSKRRRTARRRAGGRSRGRSASGTTPRSPPATHRQLLRFAQRVAQGRRRGSSGSSSSTRCWSRTRCAS